ncbi:MAG: PEGA domain-containing protein [Candidatus Uhrbacteria bacterium]|nr:PEGA domain-containing protein [Patescibacteria group bacterium]MBU1906817.1 PEGA domain-containing protein [Patescibacteria group bacterium]
MSFRIRITIVFIFIAAFLVTAPLLVLYTAGYRYNFNTGTIVQTGLFSVTSIPKGAAVIVNGKHEVNTPDFVKHLVPDEYELRLEKSGYHSWTKHLSIESKVTTFVEDVILFLVSSPQKQIYANIHDSQVSPDQNTIAYVASEASWLEVWTYNVENQEQALLWRIAEEDPTKVNLSWSADGDRLLIAHEQLNKTEFIVIDKRGQSRTELAELDPSSIQNVWWHPTDAQAIFFNTRLGTFQYRLTSQSLSQIYDASALATMMNGQPILLLEGDNQTSVFRYPNAKAELIAYIPNSTYRILPAPEPFILLEDLDRKKMLLINTTAGDQPILLNESALGAAWAPDGSGRLLYYNNFEVHIFNPWTLNDELLNRVGEAFTSAAWHPEVSAVIVTRDNVIEAIELDARDQRNTIELAKGENISTLLIQKNGQAAYFVGTIGPDRGIFSLELKER